MEKRELKKRVKGLLALVVAFMVMFGSDLTVLAQQYMAFNDGDWSGKNEPQALQAGDVVGAYTSGGTLEIYLDNEMKSSFYDYNPRYTIQTNCFFEKLDIQGKCYKMYLVTSLTPPGGNTQPIPGPHPESKPETKPQTKPEVIEESRDTAPPAEVHEHAFSWVESVAPTANSDGLSEYKCSCGLVESSQPISCGVAFTQEFNDLIRNAPENGIVENQPEMFRCYTKKMMEELAKRPDVSLKTTYVDEEGNLRSFTIPAGQAPVEDDLFYGFVYLGNRYGWE